MFKIFYKILKSFKNKLKSFSPDNPAKKNTLQNDLILLKEKEIRIQNLFSKLKEYRVYINELKQGNDLKSIEIEKKIIELNDKKNSIQQILDDLQKQLSILEIENSGVKEQLREKKALIDQLDTENRIKDVKIDRLEKEISVLKNAVKELAEENKKNQKSSVKFEPTTSNDVSSILIDNILYNSSDNEKKTEVLDSDSQTEPTKGAIVSLENDDVDIDNDLEEKEEAKSEPEPPINLRIDNSKTHLRQSATILPIQRVGAQRSDEYSKEEFLNKNRKIDYQNRPRVICFKVGLIWTLGLEFPEDEDTSEIEVFQKDCGLLRSRTNSNIFELKFITGGIEIRSKTKDYGDVYFGSNNFLAFKLHSQKLDKGVLVDKTSTGNYLAIVPKNWQYDESISGTQISQPEETIDVKYEAQYFFIDYDSKQKIGFINEYGSSVSLISSKVFYSLNGNQIEDSVEKIGPLFIKEPPEIEITDNHYHTVLHSIVIGDEGTDRENWRKEVLYNQDQRIIKLGNEFTNISGGWYFIRFYDKEFNLLDSCDFRFIPEINEVIFNSQNFIPEINGHQPFNIEIRYSDNLEFNIESNNSAKLNVLKDDSTIKIIVEKDPAIDKICISTINESKKTVKVYFTVPRIWWAISENNIDQKWQDKSIPISKNDLLDLSKSFQIKLPTRGWIKQLIFGIEGSTPREISIPSDENVVKIPLTDYSAFDVQKKLGEFKFVCSIQRGNRNYDFIPFILEISINCKYCSEFKTFQLDEYIKHLIKVHSEELFQEPRYEDIRPFLPDDLPVRIYECKHCPEDNAYIQAFSNNPIEELIRHIENEHRGLEKTIIVVSKIQEIERILSRKLPVYKKCKLCNPMKLIPEEEIKSHILLEHRSKILGR